MKKINLTLSHGRYPAYVGRDSFEKLDSLMEKAFRSQSKHTVLICDRRLEKHGKHLIRRLKKRKWNTDLISLSVSEKLKSDATCQTLYGKLLKLGAHRRTVLIALGGGVIGDLVGFIAATFLRGVPWVGVPTTLLSQVDSALGGKTGVNHPAGKNLIGAFYQPSIVACDPLFLKTLHNRDVISGLGEIVKYGLIFDPQFFNWIDRNRERLLSRDFAAFEKAIEKSVRFKLKAVERDERDLTGVREVLNFGHTFAHALERCTQYGQFRHGEAVIWGMRMATALSSLRGPLKKEDALKVESFLATLPVPALPKRVGFSEILSAMQSDKKKRGKKVRFVLLKKLGQAFSTEQVTRTELKQAWKWVEKS